MANESIIKKGVQGINQIAESIAGAEYWNKVVPGMKQLQQEAGERIAKAVTVNYDKNKILEAATNVAGVFRSAQGQSTMGDEFDKYAKEIAAKIKSPEDIDKLFKDNESILGGRDWSAAARRAKDALGAAGQTIVSPEDAYKQAGIFTKMTEVPKAYFTNPDKDIRNTRIKTAVAGYAAASIGGRYLSGGTLTRDSYGRNDIAGVPFV